MNPSEDFGMLTKEQIRDRLHLLTEQESTVSARRRALHDEIDALRRELVDRLRDEGTDVISDEDALGPGGSREPRRPKPQLGSGGAAHAEPPPDEADT